MSKTAVGKIISHNNTLRTMFKLDKHRQTLTVRRTEVSKLMCMAVSVVTP